MDLKINKAKTQLKAVVFRLRQSHRTKLPYFRNELVEKSVNGQNWQTGQSYFLAIYVFKNLKSSLQMMAFYMRKLSGGSGIRTHHDLLP